MNGYRQAALCLHGLTEEDRCWLMQQLTKEQSSKLRIMLKELEEIGIPRESYWLETVSSEPDKGQVGKRKEEIVDYLGKADPELIVAMLYDEPDCVIATLLSCHEWPWRSTVLSGFDLTRQQPLRREMDKLLPNIGPRVLDALMESAYQRLSMEGDNLKAVADQRRKNGHSGLALRKSARFWRLPWTR